MTPEERLPILDLCAELAEQGDLTGLGGKKVRWAFRAVHPDLRSRDGYRYPWPGQWAEAPKDGRPLTKNGDPCPSSEVGGLCVAKTLAGAAAGGIPFSTMLIVGITTRDVLAEDADKMRVRRMYVADVVTAKTLLERANLGFADLRFADLRSADLRSANLRSAEYNQLTLWPEGFDPKAAGAVLA